VRHETKVHSCFDFVGAVGLLPRRLPLLLLARLDGLRRIIAEPEIDELMSPGTIG
jgi:hypothetical protein